MAECRRKPSAVSHRPSCVKVEVAYALPERQELIAVVAEEGTTVREAIGRSGILARFPDIELAPGRVGVFGKVVELDSRLRDGDRVEIYRPLAADPKAARQARSGGGKRR